MKKSQGRRHGDQAGFTVLEAILMAVVLGVVAAITIPHFRTSLHESREGRTKANLGDLRGALAIYYSDNFGLYPADEGTPETRLKSVLVPAYIKEIPYVELPHLHDKKLNTVQDRFDGRGDWLYSTLGGYVSVNSAAIDTRGRPVSEW
jgi:type II secretory pathway pseudopilin PulG